MRFTCNIKTLQVTDTETGAVTHCTDVMQMARVRRDLELAARPAARPSTKEQKREERRQAGVRG